MADTLRERKKLHTHETLMRAALDLFERNGFDAVTVDEIAARAGVSQRTFFRYFSSKEAVLYADQEETMSVMREAIAARPPGEHPLRVLEAALAAVTEHTARHREDSLRRARLVDTGPSIATYQRAVVLPAWEEMFVEALADRLGVDPALDPRPVLYSGVAIAVMTAAGTRWRAADGQVDPVPLLHGTFRALEESMIELRSL